MSGQAGRGGANGSADISDLTEELFVAATAEPCSRVHFDIEPLDEQVKLTEDAPQLD